MKPAGCKNLKIQPCELRDANSLIASIHRHHKPVQGHRFSLKAVADSGIVGVAVCGRPVARLTDASTVIEITRVATDGTPNACSMLYAACRRAAQALGYRKVQTFILEKEREFPLKRQVFDLRRCRLVETGLALVSRADGRTSRNVQSRSGVANGE